MVKTWTQKENQLDFFAGFSAVTQTLFSRRGNLVTLVQFMDLVNIQYCHQKLVTMLQYRKDVTELHYCQQVVTHKLWMKIAATDLRFLRIETTRGALLSNACSSSKGAESVGFDDGVAWKVQVGCLRACCFHRWWLNCNILVSSKQFDVNSVICFASYPDPPPLKYCQTQCPAKWEDVWCLFMWIS